MTVPPGVILAGGRARRMGGLDKAFVALGGRPLIDHVIDRIGPQVSLLGISANGDPTRFNAERPVLPDTVDGFPGPLAGVLAAMDWAGELGSPWVVTVPTDTPFLPGTLVARLLDAQAASAAPIVLAETPDGLQPITGLWSAGLSGDLHATLTAGSFKVTDFTMAHGAVSVPFSERDFFNVNTPEDLARAEVMLAR
ncbi:molybdenum cofactor guanylyltransferase MobA [Maritimibacter sp. DP1N21-5]|nr:molybdenum cofactor guanylyltransferase MobA [Maritimibacter sp. DP1N21-5]